MVNGAGNDGTYNKDITEADVVDWDKEAFNGTCSTG